MGILSRFFGKKELENIDKLTELCQIILKKNQGKFLSIVGTKGKIKGLDIVTCKSPDCTYSDLEIKRINAKLAEIYFKHESLGFFSDNSSDQLNQLMLEYKKNVRLYTIPLYSNEFFIINTMDLPYEKIEKSFEKLAPLINIIKPIEVKSNEDS